MKAKLSSDGKFKVRYSKSDDDKSVLIEGMYSDDHLWTITLSNMESARELTRVLLDVQLDVAGEGV